MDIKKVCDTWGLSSEWATWAEGVAETWNRTFPKKKLNPATFLNRIAYGAEDFDFTEKDLKDFTRFLRAVTACSNGVPLDLNCRPIHNPEAFLAYVLIERDFRL